MPKFTIVMPCYNAEATLHETVTSIVEQTFTDWELICIDDNSKDGTWQILTDYTKKDSRIRAFWNPGRGPSAARNYAALVEAEGDYIAFCDADDVWVPEKLAQLDDTFRTNLVDGCYGQIGFFDTEVNQVSTYSTVSTKPLTIDQLLGENPVCTLSNLTVRRNSMLTYGGFDYRLIHNEDLEWLIRLVGQGAKIVGLNMHQVWYRASPNGLSRNLQAMAEGRSCALKTAAEFGHAAPRQAEAIHLRYLCRRALRMGNGRLVAAKLALKGLITSPSGFMSPPRRGAMTFLGAMANLIMPRKLSRALFA